MKTISAFAFAALAFASLGSTPARADDATFSTGRRFDERGGEALYRSICQGCHMPDGRGATGAGAYPALADDARLANGTYPAFVVLHGRRAMPSFAGMLDDAQVADVANYVRTHFGNDFREPVDVAQVHALRPAR